MRKWLIVLLCLAPAPLLGVSTSHWTHNSEADFKAGKLHNVVVSNMGDLKLSRAVKTILEQDAKVNSVSALAEGADGTIYAGTSPKGVLLAVKADKVSTVATIDDAVSVLSLLVDNKGGLLIGTGGDKGRVLRIDKPGDKPREIFSADGVQYIWAMAQTPDGQVYAATGPAGQLFQISPDGSHSQLYKGDENNITSVASDGKDLLYLGTDPNGMVIRLNRKTKESFVMYDASESEITALVLDGAGNLYAATGEVPELPQAAPPDQGAKEQTGRPESDTRSTPLPSNPPSAPKPPELPNPNPGEPPPIPKTAPSGSPPKMDLLANPDAEGKEDVDNPAPPPNGPPQPPGNPVPPGHAPPPPQPGSGPHAGAGAPSTENQGPKPEGNAVYKIDPDGFVTEIFRQPVIVYSMIMQNGVLLVGAGPDGNIYQVNPATQETEALAKVDPKQVMCLLAAKDGRVMLGLANAGGISAMSGGFAASGDYTSAVLDATQVSRFGKIHLDGTLPEKTTLKISTRSGNVRDAAVAGWSNWTEPVGAQEFLPVESPSARFLQYRLIFASSDGARTPVVDYVDTAYQTPNMAPVVKSIRGGAEAAGGGPAQPPNPTPQLNGPAKPIGTGVVDITWEATDPNNDSLVFTLYFRQGSAGPWILLKDKLKEATFDWDTRNVPDGRYQIKVVASDSPSNPPGEEKSASRVSEPMTVDNTPPVIGDLKPSVAGGGAKIDFTVWDQTSTVSAVDYALDSADDWQVALPVDRIFDAQKETIHLTVAGLTPGQHVVTIRATDSHGNQAFVNVPIKIEAAAAAVPLK